MNKKTILIVIVAVLVLAGIGIGSYYGYEGSHFVSTDDARVDGDLYRVMPKIAAKINSLSIQEGDTVAANQIVGQQDITNLSGSLLDEATLRAPISGTVIQVASKVGEVVAPGQSVAVIVDKSKEYISANIDETKITRIRLGETVDIHIDAYPGHTFTGKVTEIGQATASTFSLLPTTSTSGNFTKVTQRIPIKISIPDHQGLDLSPGMSAEVNIHIKS